jgi:predicted transcriptional regulator
MAHTTQEHRTPRTEGERLLRLVLLEQTQAAVAEMIGATKSGVSKYATGSRTPERPNAFT